MDRDGLISDGREGVALKLIVARLKQQRQLSDEAIEEYYDCFRQFPVDSKLKVSAASITSFLSTVSSSSSSASELSLDEAEKRLGLLTGSSSAKKFIDFEEFVDAMLRLEADIVLKKQCLISSIETIGTAECVVKLALRSAFPHSFGGFNIPGTEIQDLLNYTCEKLAI